MLVFVLPGVFLTLICIWVLWKRLKFCLIMSAIPGPRAWPIVGNALQLKRDPHDFFLQVRDWAEEFRSQGVCCVWLGPKPVVGIFKPEYVEVLLSSQENINKSSLYKFLYPWLGTGS